MARGRSQKTDVDPSEFLRKAFGAGYVCALKALHERHADIVSTAAKHLMESELVATETLRAQVEREAEKWWREVSRKMDEEDTPGGMYL